MGSRSLEHDESRCRMYKGTPPIAVATSANVAKTGLSWKRAETLPLASTRANIPETMPLNSVNGAPILVRRSLGSFAKTLRSHSTTEPMRGQRVFQPSRPLPSCRRKTVTWPVLTPALSETAEAISASSLSVSSPSRPDGRSCRKCRPAPLVHGFQFAFR